MNPAVAALILGATCIALSPIFVRVSEAGPTATAFWRVALAVPVLWFFYFLKTKQRAGRYAGRWPLLLAAGFAFAGDLGFWHASVMLTSVANSTLLANLAPIFVTLAGWLLWRQKVTPTFLLGMVTAITGMFVLVGPNFAVGGTRLAGDALGALTGMFYAGYMLAIKAARDAGASTVRLMAWSTTITAVALLPVALVSPQPFLPQGAEGWLVLAGLAVITQIVGQGLIAYAFAHLSASLSSVSLLVQPVVAALAAWAIFAEPVGVAQLVGGAIVLAGIWIARKGS
jgi:drug/metabolite transporter (DMT)-like permease